MAREQIAALLSSKPEERAKIASDLANMPRKDRTAYAMNKVDEAFAGDNPQEAMQRGWKNLPFLKAFASQAAGKEDADQDAYDALWKAVDPSGEWGTEVLAAGSQSQALRGHNVRAGLWDLMPNTGIIGQMKRALHLPSASDEESAVSIPHEGPSFLKAPKRPSSGSGDDHPIPTGNSKNNNPPKKGMEELMDLVRLPRSATGIVKSFHLVKEENWKSEIEKELGPKIAADGSDSTGFYHQGHIFVKDQGDKDMNRYSAAHEFGHAIYEADPIAKAKADEDAERALAKGEINIDALKETYGDDWHAHLGNEYFAETFARTRTERHYGTAYTKPPVGLEQYMNRIVEGLDAGIDRETSELGDEIYNNATPVDPNSIGNTPPPINPPGQPPIAPPTSVPGADPKDPNGNKKFTTPGRAKCPGRKDASKSKVRSYESCSRR